MRQHQLYFSADELRLALKDLGPPGDKGEATVATAATVLADIIEDETVQTVKVDVVDAALGGTDK